MEQGARARQLGHGSANSRVSRSDLEVEYFDEELFGGATVHDVMTRSPRVIITATDLVRAKPFAFTREQLNGICVDPRTVPVARAVFASAATPVYFAPLVMRNFAGSCGYQPPETVSDSADGRGGRLSARARRAAAVVPRQHQLPVPAPRRRRIRRQPGRARHSRRGGARRIRHRCAAPQRLLARAAHVVHRGRRAHRFRPALRAGCPSRSASRRPWTRW